jgi:hypothetical protein
MLPIALAGHRVLGPEVPTDLYVLLLPLNAGHGDMALLAFLGGLSAATGMVILAALTLSIMVAQHWIAPALVRGAARDGGATDLRPAVLAHRRIGIVLVLGLSWLYSRAMVSSDTLADIGVLSLSALTQLAPAVIAAVYAWPVSARALSLGIVAGSAAWIWLLLVPAAQQAGMLRAAGAAGTARVAAAGLVSRPGRVGAPAARRDREPAGERRDRALARAPAGARGPRAEPDHGRRAARLQRALPDRAPGRRLVPGRRRAPGRARAARRRGRARARRGDRHGQRAPAGRRRPPRRRCAARDRWPSSWARPRSSSASTSNCWRPRSRT